MSGVAAAALGAVAVRRPIAQRRSRPADGWRPGVMSSAAAAALEALRFRGDRTA